MTSSSLLEVEQKFLLTEASELEPKLKQLGFEQVTGGKIKFVDWYFDDLDSYELTTQDCWFRYREQMTEPKSRQQGTWELKRGRGQNTSSTVYEEIEGQEGIDIVISMLSRQEEMSSKKSSTTEELDGHKIPIIPNVPSNINLKPFCRLETTRSSWKLPESIADHKFQGLSIDLDTTDTGYTVGEVETLVATRAEIDAAKERIQALIDLIVDKSNLHTGPPVGKLEHFMMNNRKDHYEACITAGVIQRKY